MVIINTPTVCVFHLGNPLFKYILNIVQLPDPACSIEACPLYYDTIGRGFKPHDVQIFATSVTVQR